ncbi:MAG: DMT family transporter [Eubacteriales bacterium]
MSKSKVCLILSAFIYGFAPILAKFAYQKRSKRNYAYFFAYIPNAALLFFIMIFRKVSFKLTKKELIDIILLGVVGGSFSMISLYAAYDYISTGLATTLHFIYPLIIVITSAVVYKEKIKKIKLLAVMLVTLGMFMFVDLNNTAQNRHDVRFCRGYFIAFMSFICIVRNLTKWTI